MASVVSSMYRRPMRVVLLGGAMGIGKTTTARCLMEMAQAGPDLVQWVDVDALWFHRPWRVDEVTKAMVEANIRAVADHAAQASVDVLLITWVFPAANVHRIVAGLLPPGCEITSVQLHASHEVWARRLMGDPERSNLNFDPEERHTHHEERYMETHAVPVDHVVKTDGLTPIEVANAVALATGLSLVVSLAPEICHVPVCRLCSSSNGDNRLHLSVVADRPHVRHGLAPAAVVPGDLHGRRPRCRPYPPNPRHGTEPRTPVSA
jgi:chloramphenicol 3-O-phosphotransferase